MPYNLLSTYDCLSTNDKWNCVTNGCVNIASPIPSVFTNTANNLDIKKVIFNPPATIVLWKDGTKTVVKCKEGTEFNKWTGLSYAINKKVLGNKFKSTFKKWCVDKE